MLDGSLSDTAVGHIHGMDGSRRKMVVSSERSGKPTTGGGSGSCQFVGLGKKSSSTSQLSATGKEEFFLNFFQYVLIPSLSVFPLYAKHPVGYMRAYPKFPELIGYGICI
jgi:hypothetical protein